MWTSSRPARDRRMSQGYSRFFKGPPGFRPGITHGFPGTLGSPATTSAAAAERRTTLAPVLPSHRKMRMAYLAVIRGRITCVEARAQHEVVPVPALADAQNTRRAPALRRHRRLQSKTRSPVA